MIGKGQGVPFLVGSRSYDAVQVVVPVQQVYAPGAVPGEALCDR